MRTAIICVSYVIMAARVMMGLPCMSWGFLIGVIGFGPEGLVPLSWRLVGLCFLFGGAGLAYPISLLPTRRYLAWLSLTLSLLPFSMLVLDYYKFSAARAELMDRLPLIVALLGVVLTFAEAIISRHMRQSGTP
ncbi:MAG: hypothetical protein ABFC96_04035 [Thermoguttaceae bacterium]